jgi:signal transduction histidine kinase
MITLTREQLEERLLALHAASLELVQDISIDSLLERIAIVACEQVGARYAAVGVLNENGELEQFIPIGLTEMEIQKMPHPPIGRGLIGALMRGNQSIRIPEISIDKRSSGFPENHPDMHSFLGVPIRLGEQNLGQIYLTDKKDAPEFSEDDQMLIEMLASYAAVAISNARMYKVLTKRDHMLTRRNENMALLNELASTLSLSTDVDQILDKAVSQVMDYLRLEVGEVYLVQEDQRMLSLVLHRGDQVTSLWKRTEFKLGEGYVGVTAKDGQVRLLNLPSDDNDELNDQVRENHFFQVACLPLSSRSGVNGVLCVGTSNPQPLDEVAMQFLAAISSWVGTAIENVHLNLQGRRLAILEERERIGMDLHDGIIQSIYAVGLTLEHARLLMGEDVEQAQKRIAQSIDDLNCAIRDIRSYILDLRPRQLHDESLPRGIQRLVNEMRSNSLMQVNLYGPPEEDFNLSETKAKAIFHICQEALANIARHAQARSVNVTLWKSPDRILLEVIDDGRGFDFESTRKTIGHGLANMQSRARSVGGDVELTTEPGEGTTVLVWIPNDDES